MEQEGWNEALFLLLGAALTWAFYFVQRRVERRGDVDAIERHQKLLALKQGLDGANVDLDELRRFERRLIGKAEVAVRLADDYFTRAEQVARDSDDARISQDEMNQQAATRFERVDRRLDALVVHLRRQLDAGNRATFDEAHRAWLRFRECYARFISQSYSTGAIRPLIHAVTLESITAAWTTELETQLGDESLGED